MLYCTEQKSDDTTKIMNYLGINTPLPKKIKPMQPQEYTCGGFILIFGFKLFLIKKKRASFLFQENLTSKKSSTVSVKFQRDIGGLIKEGLFLG